MKFNWTYFIISVVICLIAYIIYGYFSKRQYYTLISMFYRENKVDQFLAELDTTKSKLFFTTKVRNLMKIDAYMAKKDYASLYQVFEYLNKSGLRVGDRYTVLQKEVLAYADNNDGEKAKAAIKEMEDMLPKFKKDVDHYEAMLQESRYVVAIKVDKDGKYAEELAGKAREIKMPVAKGMYYIKASQSYCLRGENKLAKNRLEDAYGYLKDTTYGKVLKDILDSNDIAKVLEIYI